jgi:hypothetical protein
MAASFQSGAFRPARSRMREQLVCCILKGNMLPWPTRRHTVGILLARISKRPERFVYNEHRIQLRSSSCARTTQKRRYLALLRHGHCRGQRPGDPSLDWFSGLGCAPNYRHPITETSPTLRAARALRDAAMILHLDRSPLRARVAEAPQTQSGMESKPPSSQNRKAWPLVIAAPIGGFRQRES